METTRALRWTGLALMLAGLFTAGGSLLHPNDADPQAAQQALWAPAHFILIIGLLLTLFGLIGLYQAQSDRGGALGLAGFGLTFVGIALVIPVIVIDAFIFPALAATAAARPLLDEAGPLLGGPLGLVLLLATALPSLGMILLASAMIRVGRLPRLAGALLLVGGPLLAGSGLLPQFVGTAGGVLVGVSFLWSGFLIWAGVAQAGLAMAQPPQPHPQR